MAEGNALDLAEETLNFPLSMREEVASTAAMHLVRILSLELDQRRLGVTRCLEAGNWLL